MLSCCTTIIIAELKRLSCLCGKERSEQRVEAASTEVRDAEVDERESLSSTHRSEVDDATARFLVFIARRSEVLRQRHGGPVASPSDIPT